MKLAILILFISNSFIFAIEIGNLSEAVNIAGKQRMYTQRMLKDYAMVGMHNTFGKPEKDLADVMKNFEEHMNALYDFTKDETTKKSIKKAQKLWNPIKQTLNSPPSKDSAAKLQESLEELLKVADETTKLFAKQTGKTSGEIINISGRQRMLSQRMASLYMLKVWGIDDPKFSQKMNDSMNLFKRSLDKLLNYEKNTPDITQLLNKAKRSFKFFEFMNRSKSKFIPSLIYKKSNDILKNMNTATGLYTKIENG
jgi:nitrate/nitrite-specific signal transduction histidine kinase